MQIGETMTSKDVARKLEDIAMKIRDGELNWFLVASHAHPWITQGILAAIWFAIGLWVRGRFS